MGYLVNKQNRKVRNAIFVVVEEHACPVYNIGEEFKVEKFRLSVPSHKVHCLYLARKIADIILSSQSLGGFSVFDNPRTRFDCGGCEGMVHFEFKKEKDFATRQMKLLSVTEERQQRQHLDTFFNVVRDLDFFESLDDDALSDLTILLEMRVIPIDKVVIRQGEPGSSLYIILKGKVAVLADDGSRLAEMGAGDIFGEMSLLSGEPATSSIYTLADTQVAMLSDKNFRHVLRMYPILRLFLFKKLVSRAQILALRSGNITSGMSGDLAETSSSDLFQIINSLQKTGTVDMVLKLGKGVVFFEDGEIVHANFGDLMDKDAVYALIGIKDGHFTYTKGIPKELKNLPPIGHFMRMMVDGVQKMEEQH
jgi:CRP/FNR family transcriptional regulator, cyclic AMP receptor protein